MVVNAAGSNSSIACSDHRIHRWIRSRAIDVSVFITRQVCDTFLAFLHTTMTQRRRC
jgi:hypothetical protein